MSHAQTTYCAPPFPSNDPSFKPHISNDESSSSQAAIAWDAASSRKRSSRSMIRREPYRLERTTWPRERRSPGLSVAGKQPPSLPRFDTMRLLERTKGLGSSCRPSSPRAAHWTADLTAATPGGVRWSGLYSLSKIRGHHNGSTSAPVCCPTGFSLQFPCRIRRCRALAPSVRQAAPVQKPRGETRDRILRAMRLAFWIVHS